MNVVHGRARRPDEWPSSHVRARADLSERLDAALDPLEATWLETHLGVCPDCRIVADAYAAQRLELRALRDRAPAPPRDLWARTAAAIESEATFRDGHGRSADHRGRRRFAPSALFATALVVAVAVGSLTSSQWFGGDGDAGPSTLIAVASGPPTGTPGGGSPGSTPIPAPRTFAYVRVGAGGDFSRTVRKVREVCPFETPEPCGADAVVEDNPVNLGQDATAVFGSSDDSRLIVANDSSAAKSGTISVVTLRSNPPEVTPTPTPTPTPTSTVLASAATVAPSASGQASPSVRPSGSSGTPSASPSDAPSPSPVPSVAVTPTPTGSVEIAHDVILVGQSAAYSRNGRWFAFTARPVDGSAGPDIYLWKVGDPRANRVTTDQRSVFGSWSGDVMIGSTLVSSQKGSSAKADLEPASFQIDPGTENATPLPQTGKAWRPAVDPRGRLAAYWAGTVRTTSDPGFAPDAGALVLGDWSTDTAAADGAASPTPTALNGDQTGLRHETMIAAGKIDDWDARWDDSGTHLAVWIVDPQNPAVGRLSLYAVDSFDGRIDLKNTLLKGQPAAAGYSISDGKLVWAEPGADGSVANGKVQLLAWTDDGVGTVETVTGRAIVIR